jgi:3-dehydroquinate synthase
MSAVSEPRRLTIGSSTGPYEVIIGTGQLAEALQAMPTVVVADRIFESMLTGMWDGRPVLLDATEPNKTLSTVEHVIQEMKLVGLRRDGSMLAVGGGVVQDVATLAAQLYMRGISWSLVPTTLMSMTDSCLGGKSSINVGSTKNLVGGFYPPQTIHIDPIFADTLAPADLACGYLEAVKIAYCRGPETFLDYLRVATEPGHAGLTEVVSLTLSAKRWFIEVDEFDRAERRMLNFGHTFGHALEAGSHFAAKHGIAVGIGMLAALRYVAEERALTEREVALGDYVSGLVDGVIDRVDLHRSTDWELFRTAFDSDKKHRANCYALILPCQEGLGVALREIERSGDSLQRVQAALEGALRGSKP